MSAIRTPRTARSPRTTKSLEALSATLNRALAGARASQATAARNQATAARNQAAAARNQATAGRDADPRGRTPLPGAARTDTLAARRRTNLLIGTLERLRGPAASRRAPHTPHGTGTA